MTSLSGICALLEVAATGPELPRAAAMPAATTGLNIPSSIPASFSVARFSTLPIISSSHLAMMEPMNLLDTPALLVSHDSKSADMEILVADAVPALRPIVGGATKAAVASWQERTSNNADIIW